MRTAAAETTPRRQQGPAVAIAGVAALTLVGAVIRLAVSSQDLFADELATYWVVTTRGVGSVVRTVSTTAEITPPFSFVLSWLTTRLGQSSELIRLPALLSGVAMIPLVWALGLRTVGKTGALVGAALVALSPFMIFYASEARGYGVLMALLVVSSLALLRALDGGGTVWWAVHGLAVCLAAYTHYTGIFVLLAQFAWCALAHPAARRPLFITTAIAAAAYLPWLPHVRGDMDSPTTAIMASFSPLSVDFVGRTLGHWLVGYPFSGAGRGLADLPGRPAYLLMALGLMVGLVGFVAARRADAPEAGHGADDPDTGWWARPVTLIVVLAAATPVGSFLQSAVGTNVFGVRALASSLPYLALALAALLVAGRPPIRYAATGMVLLGMAIGGLRMTDPDFQRPELSRFARLADEHPGSVIVDGASFSPGPFTNFETDDGRTAAPVYRLFLPAQKDHPFGFDDPLPDPDAAFLEAVRTADGNPIIVLDQVGGGYSARVEELLDLMPTTYQLTQRVQPPGAWDVQAFVYEMSPGG